MAAICSPAGLLTCYYFDRHTTENCGLFHGLVNFHRFGLLAFCCCCRCRYNNLELELHQGWVVLSNSRTMDEELLHKLQISVIGITIEFANNNILTVLRVILYLIVSVSGLLSSIIIVLGHPSCDVH